MKLTPAELAYVRCQDLYITEKCDACLKLLNQSLRYTIRGKPEVYCSAECRDRIFFGEKFRAKNKAAKIPRTQAPCGHCGGEIIGRKHGSAFCSQRCKQANWRKTPESQKSGTIGNTDLVKSIA